MSCPTDELKDLLLGELPAAQIKGVRAHAAQCLSCRAELEQWELLSAALQSVRNEEPPQRIAFVSDKVFQPRWWERIARSGPVMGLASASVLAAAILVHGASLAPSPVPPALAAKVDQKQLQAEVDRRLSEMLPAAVEKVVAVSVQHQKEDTMQLISTARRDAERDANTRYAATIRGLMEQVDYEQKKNSTGRSRALRASYDAEVPR